jgi:dTDP-4-amino-4,6-dideoxygalactose transaminase
MIPFNKPYLTGLEVNNISQVISSGNYAGNGLFTKRCNKLLEISVGCKKALLTNSCTDALEMAAILAGIELGDEIIMPSYTFVSTANAFVRNGGVPVFVDIRKDTLNLDESLIEGAITSRTKAIVPVHYAGVSCEMDEIINIASKNNLIVIEDAAQGVGATYKGRPLGSIGDLGAFSFHETKNITSGEGGALLVNKEKFIKRSEVVWQKGTNRDQFDRAEIERYTWIDKGSSFVMNEMASAFLYDQLQQAEYIKQQRLNLWEIYHKSLEKLECSFGKINRPVVPGNCKHNGHIYYILLENYEERCRFINYMQMRSISCVFHYVPLHSSPGGLKYSRFQGSMTVTNNISDRLVRLPLWIGLQELEKIIIHIYEFFGEYYSKNY